MPILAFLSIVLCAQGLSLRGKDAPAKVPVVAAVTSRHQETAVPRAKSITQAINDSGSDKTYRHGYHRYYERELAPYKDVDGLSILEIGAERGRSLKTWVEYFSKPSRVDAVAYMADPVKAKAKACEAGEQLCKVLSIYNVDQSKPEQLEQMAKEVDAASPAHPGWDIIIDDGSHVPMHQLTSFKHLFPKLRPGGLYVVEDTETSYAAGNADVYGYKFSAGIDAAPGDSAVNKFMELVPVVDRHHFLAPDLTVFGKEVDSTVAGVRFGDGIIFIEKKPDDPNWDKYPAVDAVPAENWPIWFKGQADSVRTQSKEAVHRFEERVAKEIPIP